MWPTSICNCSGRRETSRRIGARTFLSASGDLPRSADNNVRAPTRDLNSYLDFYVVSFECGRGGLEVPPGSDS